MSDLIVDKSFLRLNSRQADFYDIWFGLLWELWSILDAGIYHLTQFQGYSKRIRESPQEQHYPLRVLPSSKSTIDKKVAWTSVGASSVDTKDKCNDHLIQIGRN